MVDTVGHLFGCLGRDRGVEGFAVSIAGRPAVTVGVQLVVGEQAVAVVVLLVAALGGARVAKGVAVVAVVVIVDLVRTRFAGEEAVVFAVAVAVAVAVDPPSVWIGGVVIDDTVAVVVFAVADLGSTGEDLVV